MCKWYGEDSSSLFILSKKISLVLLRELLCLNSARKSRDVFHMEVDHARLPHSSSSASRIPSSSHQTSLGSHRVFFFCLSLPIYKPALLSVLTNRRENICSKAAQCLAWGDLNCGERSGWSPSPSPQPLPGVGHWADTSFPLPAGISAPEKALWFSFKVGFWTGSGHKRERGVCLSPRASPPAFITPSLFIPQLPLHPESPGARGCTPAQHWGEMEQVEKKWGPSGFGVLNPPLVCSVLLQVENKTSVTVGAGAWLSCSLAVERRESGA